MASLDHSTSTDTDDTTTTTTTTLNSKGDPSIQCQ